MEDIMKDMDIKYAKLLLTKCLSFNNTDTLLIEYMTHEQDDFVKTVVEVAKSMGINNIELSCNDVDEVRNYLNNTNVEDIKLNPIIDKSKWDEVSKKHGCILHINTFIPNFFFTFNGFFYALFICLNYHLS